MNEDLILQKEKILELLYSGEPTNNVLAFELMQHLEDKSPFVLPFVAALYTPIDEESTKYTDWSMV